MSVIFRCDENSEAYQTAYPVRLNKERLSILTGLLTMTGVTHISLACPFLLNILEVS